MNSEKNVVKKMKNLFQKFDKRMISIIAIIFVVMLIGATYAFFTYNKVGETASTIIAGNIKMEMKSTNLELGDEMYPMSSADGIMNGVKYSFSVNGYNESNKDIYYGVYINAGEEQSGKVRLNDSDIMMVLNETVNGETKVVYGPGTLADFNNSLIHANMISSGVSKNEGVAIDYELTAWVSEKVLITDTQTDVEGRSIYSQEDYANSYASLKVTVVGDFSEKTAQDGTVTINAYTKSDQITYITNLSYEETPWVNDEVIVDFAITKEPSKLVITNELTNVKEEVTPVKKGDVWTYQREETASGKYSYYVEYKDGKSSDIFHYNVRIDKEAPTFTMEAGERIKAPSSDETVTISNVISGITDENGVEIKYALIVKGGIVDEYTVVNNNKDNYEVKEDVPSGIYELHVVVTDASGKEYHDYVTYEVSYDLPLIDTLQVSEKDTIEVIEGQQINYIESLEELSLDSYTFLGWSSDQAGINIVTNQTIVTDEIKALYANWHKNGSDLIITFVGNGATIDKESDTCFAESGGSCTVTLPTITREGYEIVGWSTNKNSHSGITGEASVSADATYYAITRKTIAVTFELNGAASLIKDNTTTSATMTETCDMYNEEASCNITSLGITGSTNTPTVVGWHESRDGHTSTWDVNVSKSFSEKATYYAQTKKEAVVKAVTYKSSTGVASTGKTSDSCTINETYNGVKQADGCNVTLPSITVNTGYTVLGWYEGSTKVGNALDTYELTTNKTLTATASILNINSTSGTTTYGDNEEITITVTGTNYGTLTCESSDDSVGSCSVSGNTITITPGNAGTAEITISSTNAGDVTYELTVNKRSVTYTANSASKVYDGTALTKNSATLTSGTLASGHAAIFTISGSITNVGSVTNTLSGVVIKNASGTDVSSNYNITRANGTLTVTYASVTKPTASSHCNTLTYNGSVQTMTKAAATGYWFNRTSETNAGTYEIIAQVANNYQWSDGTRTAVTFKCSIAKRAVTYTAGSSSRAYNGSALTNSTASLTSGTLVNGHTASFTINGTITNVGSVTNTLSAVVIKNASGTDVSSNYNITRVNGTLTVTHASVTKPTATSHCNSVTYNGSAQTITKTAGTGYSFNPTTGTNATTYEITATLGSNYQWSDGTRTAVTFECSIAKKAVTYTAGSTSRAYNGSALTNNTATLTSGTLVSGHTATFTITGSITNVGSATNTLSAVVIKNASGTDVSSNYNITRVNGTLTITYASATKPTATSHCNSVTYNGSSQTITKTAGTGYSFNTTTGTNATTYTITATLGSNYQWSDGTRTAVTFQCSIAKRAVTYTAGSSSRVYNGTALTNNTASLTTGTLVSGHTASFTINGTITNVGSVTNTLSGVVIKNASGTDVSSNYNITKVNGTLTVTYASVTKPTASSHCNTLTYNGSVQTMTKAAATGYWFNRTSETNAGTYEIIAQVADNYQWSDGTRTAVTFQCSIAKRAVTYTAGSTSRAYNGSALTNSTASLTSGTLVSGHTASFTITGSITNVGSVTNTLSAVVIKNASGTDVSSNYNITKVNGTLTVTAKSTASFTVTLGTTEYDYDGTAKTPTVTVKDGTKTLTNGTDYTVSYTNNINAGTASVTITGKGNYSGSTIVNFTINKIDPILTLSATSGSVNAGSTITFTEKANVIGDFKNVSGTTTVATVSPATINDVTANTAKTVTITGVSNGTSEITVTFTPNDTTNYNTVSKKYTVTGYKVASTGSCASLTYNGSSQTLVTGGTGVNYTNNSLTNATSQKVTISLQSGYRWSDGTTANKELTCSIAKKAVTYTAGSSSRVYNGSALTNNTASLTTGTLVSGHTATFTITGSITNVGSVTNTLSAVVIKNASGTDVSSNYNITKVNGTLTVTYASVTKPTASSHCNTLTYNGSVQTMTKAAATGYWFNRTSETNAGTYEIIAQVADNYQWSDGTRTAVTFHCSIAKRAVTYTAGSTSRAYNGSALTNNTATLTSGTLVSGHTASFTITGTITNFGSVTNTLSAVVIKNASGTDISSNYNITKVNGTLTITRANATKPTATSHCNSVTYNGSSQTITKTAGTGYSFNTTTGTNATTYTITATLGSNYQWSDGTRTAVTFECSIAKKAVTYTAGSSSRAYNGSALTNSTASLTSGTLVSGHTATFTITGSITDFGSATNTLSAVVIKNASGTDVSSNYNITKVNGTLTITRASLTKPSASTHCNTLTYNGSAQTMTKTATTGYWFNRTSETNAGTYEIIAQVADNYQWSDETRTNVVFYCTISPLSVAVSWSGNLFDYDGNLHTPTASATGVSGETLNITATGATAIGTHTSTATLNSVTGGQAKTANYTLTNTTYQFTIRIGERTYTARFYRNGAASIGGSTSEYLEKSCTIPAGNTATTCNVTSPTITGSTNTPTVIGWSASAATHTSSLGQNTAVAISEDVVYYAQTSGSATYAATFNLNGASSMTYNGTTYSTNANLSCTTATVYNGAAKPAGCTITLPSITRSGYTVAGWGNNASTPSTVYPVGGQLNVTSAGGTYYAITALGTTNLADCTTDSWETSRCIFKGANPDNYIYFNCTDEATRSGCEVWRIYSRESDGTLRVVNLAGKFSYVYSSGATDSTTWANSGIKTHLNATYYSGLKSSAQNRIVESVYKYGGYTMSASHKITNIINAESSSDTTNVGLLRISEFMRASSSSEIASTTVGSSSTADSFRGYNSPVQDYNWLAPGASEQYWSSTKSGTSGTSQLTLYNNSAMLYARPMTSGAYVIPVVTLDKGILLGGSGTSSDPYYINTYAMAGTTSEATCSISVTNASTYETSKTLTMSVTTNDRTLASSPYMWSTVGTWGTSKTTTVSQSGVITGYIKDTLNTTNKCTVSLTSRTEYRKQDCTSFYFGSWGNTATHVGTYLSGQVPSTYTTYTQAYAEANDALYFYYVFRDDEADSCDAVGGVTPCYHVLRKSRYGSCTAWGSYGSWQTSSITSSWKRNVETRTTYAKA